MVVLGLDPGLTNAGSYPNIDSLRWRIDLNDLISNVFVGGCE